MGFVAWSIRNGELVEGMPLDAMSKAMLALDRETPGITLDQLPSAVCLYRNPRQKHDVRVSLADHSEVDFDKNGVAWLPASSRAFFQFATGSALTMAISPNGRVRTSVGLDPDLPIGPVIPAGTPAMQAQAMAWLEEGKVGRSSAQMCFTLTGVGEESGDAPAPRDIADFRRCLGFLDAVPEARRHLGLLRDLGPAWAGLVDRWDEVEGAVREGQDPKRAAELFEEAVASPQGHRKPGPR